jgi:hypothetical protein
MSLRNVTVQAAAPAVGSVEVIVLPDRSTATHSDTAGPDRPSMKLPGSIRVSLHAPEPPAGFLETAMLWALSYPTHSDTEGHDIPSKTPVLSM